MGSQIHVIGAGGHAKVVVALAEAAGYQIAGVYDDHPAAMPAVLGHRVVGPVACLEGATHVLAILAIGSNVARRDLAVRFPGLTWATLVHPAAWVAPSAVLGEGTVVMAGAVVQPDSCIGRHVIVNSGATVDHDADLGDFVHVAPGCSLAGNVILEEGAFLGVGARLTPGVQVGAWATVGAGAVVIRPIPERAIAVGVPARVLSSRE